MYRALLSSPVSSLLPSDYSIVVDNIFTDNYLSPVVVQISPHISGHKRKLLA